MSFTYKEQCLDLLKNEFRKIYLADIRTAMRKYNFHYAPSRKCLEDSLLALGCSLSSDSSGSDTNLKNSSPMIPAPCVNTSSSTIPIRKLMGQKRGLVSPLIELEKELLMEIEFVKKQKMLKEEKKDEIYAMHLNEEQYETEGQLIECGCCFGEFPFEDIVQCSDAHLFCRQCLQSYAKEVIFGSAIATAKLHCMSDGCTKPFPLQSAEEMFEWWGNWKVPRTTTGGLFDQGGYTKSCQMSILWVCSNRAWLRIKYSHASTQNVERRRVRIVEKSGRITLG